MTNFDYIAVAKKVLEIESKALTKQIDQIDQAFVNACELAVERLLCPTQQRVNPD